MALLPAMTLPSDCQIVIGPNEQPKMRAIVEEAASILAPGLKVIEQPDHEAWTFATLHYVTPQQIPPLTKQPVAMSGSPRACHAERSPDRRATSLPGA